MEQIIVPKSIEFPLPRIATARGSSFTADIAGIPDDVENVQIHIGVAGSSNLFNAVPCDARQGGIWRVYATGAFFPSVGDARYHLTARDRRGESVYLGQGRLDVRASVLNVPEGDVPVLPKDTYVRGTNGLFYPLTVELDENGVPYPVIGEGVQK